MGARGRTRLTCAVDVAGDFDIFGVCGWILGCWGRGGDAAKEERGGEE